MKLYAKAELIRFLEAVDAHLGETLEVTVIGGAAAILAYQCEHGTTDVDVYGSLPPRLLIAAAAAREDTSLQIEVESAAVADVPYDATERFEDPADLRFEHLRIRFLEVHDWALSKLVRGNAADLQLVEEAHRRSTLSVEILATRFREEMGHAIGDPARHRMTLLALVARLFGDQIADAVEATLESD